MSDELRERAEKVAKKYSSGDHHVYIAARIGFVDGYIAGAKSRDEYINNLIIKIGSMGEFKTKFLDLCTDFAKARDQITELREALLSRPSGVGEVEEMIWLVLIHCISNPSVELMQHVNSRWACQTSANFFSGQQGCSAVCLKDKRGGNEKTKSDSVK
jgi:hypothetical protein